MFVAMELSEIWLLLLTLSLLSLLLLLLLLLSMLAMTLETAVAETTAKVRNPVTEKTLSCFSMHVGFGVTTWEVRVVTNNVEGGSVIDIQSQNSQQV